MGQGSHYKIAIYSDLIFFFSVMTVDSVWLITVIYDLGDWLKNICIQNCLANKVANFKIAFF